MFTKKYKTITTISITTLMFVSFLLFLPTKANALSGSDFNAGRIIDDFVFYDSNSMNTGQIQQFLNAKVPNCDTWGTQPYGGTTRAAYASSRGVSTPFTCLKNYSQSVPSVIGNQYCSGTILGGNKSSAEIIYDVAQACGVSPKVLLVLLQKEQSLVTDDWPWPIQYRSATGYGCPDTAPCDAEYYGFFNQVYQAAKAYKRYRANPANYNYRAGRNNTILWNPNAGCGTSDVYIDNQATAGLYIYTPYRPNQAALNNLYGTGDGCSSYGNRNFWRMYSDWFGSVRNNIAWGWSITSKEIYSNPERTQLFTGKPTVLPGEKLYIRIIASNVGTNNWQKSFLNIGTSNPFDRGSVFKDTSWISSVRPTSLIEPSVGVGQSGTFEFTLKAPNQVGSYTESFKGVADGRSWLWGDSANINLNVVSVTNGNLSLKRSLESGESLKSGEYLITPDSNATFQLTQNSNLDLRTNFISRWASNTTNSGGKNLIMQGDGNLVLYSNNSAVWNSGTAGNPNARLILQSDGNLVLYSSAGTPLWYTGTTHNPSLMNYVNESVVDSYLLPEQSLSTADRKYKLIMQGDGNLVLYKSNHPIWASWTQGREKSTLAIQGDGNLVIYNSAGQPTWASWTYGSGLSYLTIQGDGNLVIYNSAGQPTWASWTQGK